MKILKTTNCKYCGAEIAWLKSDKGKNIPIDIETLEDFEATIFDPETMTSHLDTCRRRLK